MNRWMEASLNRSKRLKDLYLLGSHDSAAYCVDYGTKRSSSSFFGRVLSNFLSFCRGSFVARLINRWVVTQHCNIFQQLESGLRVLDLRISYFNDEFYLSHTFACIVLADGIQQIKDFLKQNPNEVIFISAKPDYHNRETIKQVESILLNDFIFKEFDGLLIRDEKKTYGEILQTKERIYFSYRCGLNSANNNSNNNNNRTSSDLLINENKVKEIWLNVPTKQQWIEKFNFTVPPKLHNKREEEGENDDSTIYMLDCVLTPTKAYVVRNIFPDKSLRKMAKEMEDVVLFTPLVGNPPLLLMVDFPSEKLIEHMIRRNLV